ncbi:small RNA 2'-O-methyltransferase-like [Paramacrobiotus metropolitanus]|uniref:small RNA 2'-O-methyltransferase-like n=1 Tax=Paramacrobiotus metropolitanus TaxID=2943436 RepID=UPI0024460E90|nr:small RNA 2'-O-methyltransferase-like [Paramacrobiotus metropolitanus]
MAVVQNGIPDYYDLGVEQPENGDDVEPYYDAEQEPSSSNDVEVLELPEFGGGDHDEPLFSPPLYIQRYCCVEKLIDDYNKPGTDEEFKSLVDIGCAELKFLLRAKNGRMFERIVGLDVDEFLVGSSCRRLQPMVFDMMNTRDRPLKVHLFVGDATVPDQRLVAVDVVTAIELIEHMETETHEALVQNVFGLMQPKLAIFTTPNVEYNPLFPGGSIEQRRHWDHRFEWTRAEFQTWANSVADRFPYTVLFSGAGEGPDGTLESHGYCSQIATFVRDAGAPRNCPDDVGVVHKLVQDYTYPWAPPKSLQEQLVDIVDAECYTLAKELQDIAESENRFNVEWFTFPVSELYATRWRLQDMLKPPNHLQPIRDALMLKNTDWRIYSQEKDEVSYRLIGPESDEPENDLGAQNLVDLPVENVAAWD